MTGKELDKQKSYPWDIVKSKITLIVTALEVTEGEDGVKKSKVKSEEERRSLQNRFALLKIARFRCAKPTSFLFIPFHYIPERR